MLDLNEEDFEDYDDAEDYEDDENYDAEVDGDTNDALDDATVDEYKDDDDYDDVNIGNDATYISDLESLGVDGNDVETSPDVTEEVFDVVAEIDEPDNVGADLKGDDDGAGMEPNINPGEGQQAGQEEQAQGPGVVDDIVIVRSDEKTEQSRLDLDINESDVPAPENQAETRPVNHKDSKLMSILKTVPDKGDVIDVNRLKSELEKNVNARVLTHDTQF